MIPHAQSVPTYLRNEEMQQWFAEDMKSLAKLNQILEGKRN